MSQRDEQLSLLLRRMCRRLAAPRELPDRQLLERFLLFREETAFELLVRRHGPLVLGVCRRLLGDEHAAEDAFQATFLLLARKAGAIQRRESVGSWLYGVAYHTALKLRAQVARRRRCEQLAARCDAVKNEQAAPHLEALLDEEVQRLPAKYRIPIVLCYLEGRTLAEAAVELGWPVGTVAGRLARARNLLRDRLTRRGVTIAVAILATTLAGQSASAMPLSLTQTAVQGALALVAGKTAALCVTNQAMALMEGMVRAMNLHKIHALCVIVLTVGLVGTGAGVGGYRVLAQPQDTGKPPTSVATQPNPAAGKEPEPSFQPMEMVEEVAVLKGHTGDVYSAAFSPDGRQIMSAGADGTVRVWDVNSGQIIRVLEGHKDAIRSLAFTPDGKLLASGADDGTLRLWDGNSGKELRAIDVAVRPIRSLAISPDGKLLATGAEDHTVRLWDTTTGKQLRVSEVEASGGKDAGLKVDFSPDGRLLATASADHSVSLRNVPDLRIIARYEGYADRVNALAFSPDGKKLASGSADRSVHIVDVPSGKILLRVVTGDAVLSVAFSPDGKMLATAGADGTVRLWEAASGKEIVMLKVPEHKAVWSVKFAPDGKRLATADDKTVRLWNVETRGFQAHKAPANELVNKWAAKANKETADGDRLDQLAKELVASKKSDEQVIDALFLATLGRFPAENEKKFTADHLAKGKDRSEAIADILWSLTNSLEFGAHVTDLGRRTRTGSRH